jgi:hypothetical protein
MSNNPLDSKSILVNPERTLIDEVAARLRPARKNKPLWAKRVDASQEVRSIEAAQKLHAGDYLCRGVRGEFWPQSEKKLLETYVASQEIDSDGFRRYDPKPNSEPVDVAQVAYPFRVIASWGELQGKAGDYVVRSRKDASDAWIVDKAIFEGSYEFCNDKSHQEK